MTMMQQYLCWQRLFVEFCNLISLWPYFTLRHKRGNALIIFYSYSYHILFRNVKAWMTQNCETNHIANIFKLQNRPWLLKIEQYLRVLWGVLHSSSAVHFSDICGSPFYNFGSSFHYDWSLVPHSLMITGYRLLMQVPHQWKICPLVAATRFFFNRWVAKGGNDDHCSSIQT